MGIDYLCDNCGAELNVGAEWIGNQVKCKHCAFVSLVGGKRRAIEKREAVSPGKNIVTSNARQGSLPPLYESHRERSDKLENTMEMPKSIKLFEQLFLGSLILGIIQSALMSDELAALMHNDLGLSGDAAYAVAGFQFLIIIFIGALVLLTSRKKSVICKWIITVNLVSGIFMFIPTLAAMLEQGVMGLISIAQLCMQVYAVYLLFNADSKEWFASKNV